MSLRDEIAAAQTATEEAAEPTPEAPDSDSDDGGFLESIKSSAMDFSRGLAEGSSFGLSGEIAGTVGGLQDAAMGPARTSGRGIDAPVMGAGDRLRVSGLAGEAASDEELARAHERSPVLTTAGDVAGAVATSGLPGGMLAKLAGKAAPGIRGAMSGAGPLAAGAGRVAKLAATVGEGAAVSGMQAAGRGEDVGEAMTTGGALAGVFGALGMGLAARAVRQAAKTAATETAKAARYRQMSDERLLQAAGFERGMISKVMNQPGGVKGLAQGIREQGLARTRTLPTARDFLEDAHKLRQRAVAGMDAASKTLEQAGAIISSDKVATRIEREIVAAARKAGAQSRAAEWQRYADDLREAGDDLRFSDGHARRMELDAQSGFQMAAKPSREAYKAARAIMAEEMEAAARKLDPAVAELWTQSNRSYGVAKQVIDAAGKSVTGKAGNQPFGLGDMIAGSGGASAGAAVAGAPGVVAAIPSAMALRAAQARGNIVASKGLQSLAKRSDAAASGAGSSATSEAAKGAAVPAAALAGTKKRDKAAPPYRLQQMLPATPPKRESHIAKLVREAMAQDPTQAAAEHYMGAANDAEYREGTGYNTK